MNFHVLSSQSSKVASIVNAIGQKTLVEIAAEGPECQVWRLMES